MNLKKIGGFRIGVLGMLTLIVGMFTPVLSAAGFGPMPLWRFDLILTALVLFSAAVTFLLLAFDFARPGFYVGLLNLGLLAFGVWWVLAALPLLRDQLERRYPRIGTSGGADALIASLHLEWGWLVLFLGSTLLVLGAAVMGRREPAA